jgi:tRNA (adenine22-N1)-methyltransferase
MGQIIKLSDRLMTIAGFIKQGAVVADIGSDHGYLPVYLAQCGLARGIIASDISAGSLKSAQRSAVKYGVSEKISFIVAAGLEGIDETETDTIVIAGLGGETIAGILKESSWTKQRGARLILQPQSKTNELCCFLRENGYCVLDAKLAHDSDRFYIIILAIGGKSDSMLEPEFELFARLMYRRDPLFPNYMDMLIAKARHVLSSMEKCNAAYPFNMKLRLDVYVGLKEAYENAHC